MKKTSLRVLSPALLLALASCAHGPVPPTEALDRAAREAQAPDASARTLALAGFRAWLVDADPTKAQSRFDAALLKSAGEPYALFGQVLLARRRGHPEVALATALELLERAPTHPLSTAAARDVLDLAGTAISMDGAILAHAPKALAAGLAGDGAHLLRSAVASIQAQRGQKELHDATNADLGLPDRYTLLGPFSPFHYLSFDEPTPPEKDGSLAGPFQGPFGPIAPRVLPAFGGRINLGGEAPDGDVFLLAADLEVKEAADYAIRVVTSTAYKVYLDGTLVAQNRPFERLSPTVGERAFSVPAGRHRLLVRTVREERTGSFVVAVMRVDGKPSRIAFTPAQGPAPRWSGVPEAPAAPLMYSTAQQFDDALRPEAGDVLAAYLAIRDAMGRDRDGAKRLMEDLARHLHGPAITSLRADLSLGDRTVPQRVARGRATRDLETTLEKDPGDVNALITRAVVALEDSRPLDAAEVLKQARAATNGGGVGYPIPLLEARVQLALNVDAQAEQSALEALKVQPGLCDALTLRYDLARRRDAVALSDELVKALEPCPGNLYRSAEHARMRGDLPRAIALYEELADRDPGQVASAARLANLYVSQRRFDDAAKRLQREREIWPRNAGVVKQLGDVYELWGKPEQALAAREEAIKLDGGDLPLRRTVERARTGKELLADQAVDGKKAIADYEASPGSEETAYSYVLDAAAIRAYPDGSMVDRIHIIQKALDQSGISEIAEVNVPGGAQVLALRTIKANGTVLEPENIEGKESVSLPGVQVGDYVEYEYLLAHAPRGPALPGFTASNFYFQIGRVPNNWSTYVVLAPRGTGMKVDAHNVRSPQPSVEGDQEVYRHDERHVPPYIPEPDSPPSPTEYLPFVSVGAGATGNAGVVAVYSDAYLDKGEVTFEVEQFARQAAAGKTGLEAVKAVYAAVMQRLSGRDSGLTGSAASSVAQDRGSRLWALKAGLEAIGVPTRMAAIRTFAADPASYLFPNESLLPFVCLRAEVPKVGEVWLDTQTRFAPFGELPEQARGGREAWLFPEPGRPIAQVKSPPQVAPPGKEIRLTLALAADGRLSGAGAETYQGLEAARLAEALEALSPDQRNQALQSALSKYFGGADLTGLKLELIHEVGAPLTVRYSFNTPNFARREGDALVLGSVTFPARLGKRFVQTGSRTTPLFIDETERTHTVVELTLPPGMQLSGPVPEINSKSRYGSFVRREKQEKDKVLIEEDYRLDMARIPPAQYDDFAQFAGEVDLIQSRDLVIRKP